MKNYFTYFKDLPEMSTVVFVDDKHKPLDVTILEGDDWGGPKNVEVILKYNLPDDVKINMYDLKLLSGIDVLARYWEDHRESFFEFACQKSKDARWRNDPDYREYMYDKYINTDRPITDRLYNLDQYNLQTLFQYITEELMSGTATRYVDSGIRFKEPTFKNVSE